MKLHLRKQAMGPVWPLRLQFTNVQSKWILLKSWPICQRLTSKSLKVAAHGIWRNWKIPPCTLWTGRTHPHKQLHIFGSLSVTPSHRAQSTVRDCGPAPCGVLRPRLLLGFRTRVCLRRKPSLEKSLVKTLCLKH